MSLENYLSGKLKAPSGKGANFDNRFYARNGLRELSANVKNRMDSLSDFVESKGVDLVKVICIEENFSINSLPRETYDEEKVIQYVKEYYESLDFKYCKELPCGSLKFSINQDKDLIVTISTLPLTFPLGDSSEEGELLVTTTVNRLKGEIK